MRYTSAPKEPSNLTGLLGNPRLMVSCTLAGRHPYLAPDQIWTAVSSYAITAWPYLFISSSSLAVSCSNSSRSALEADLSEIGLGLLYEKPSLPGALLSVRTLQDIQTFS